MPRYVVACDAGGTMTDVIIVDEEGRSVIGKAPTSPQDESIGYMESFWEALEFMGISQEEGRDFGKQIETAIYTGTSMLNTVINIISFSVDERPPGETICSTSTPNGTGVDPSSPCVVVDASAVEFD